MQRLLPWVLAVVSAAVLVAGIAILADREGDDEGAIGPTPTVLPSPTPFTVRTTEPTPQPTPAITAPLPTGPDVGAGQASPVPTAVTTPAPTPVFSPGPGGDRPSAQGPTPVTGGGALQGGLLLLMGSGLILRLSRRDS